VRNTRWQISDQTAGEEYAANSSWAITERLITEEEPRQKAEEADPNAGRFLAG